MCGFDVSRPGNGCDLEVTPASGFVIAPRRTLRQAGQVSTQPKLGTFVPTDTTPGSRCRRADAKAGSWSAEVLWVMKSMIDSGPARCALISWRRERSVANGRQGARTDHAARPDRVKVKGQSLRAVHRSDLGSKPASRDLGWTESLPPS